MKIKTKYIISTLVLLLCIAITRISYSQEQQTVPETLDELNEDYTQTPPETTIPNPLHVVNHTYSHVGTDDLIDIAMPEFTYVDRTGALDTFVQNTVAKSVGYINNVLDDHLIDMSYGNADVEYEHTFPHDVWLTVIYDYTINDDIVSIRITSDYFTGGTHSLTFVTSSNINLLTGQVYSLKSLFTDNGQYIEEQVIEKIKANPDKYFNFNEDVLPVLEAYDGDYNYFLSGNNVVVYFNNYDISPYSTGIVYFVFDAEELKAYLKPEIYESINDQLPPGDVYVNGLSYDIPNSVIVQDNIVWVPLEDVGEILGYEIGETAEGVPTVDGESISGVTQYLRVEDVVYVPISYFAITLGEHIYYSDDKLRIFQKGNPGEFIESIKNYRLPESPIGAAETFADARKSNNTYLELQLYIDDLQKRIMSDGYPYDNVPGTTISSYQITDLGNGQFRIIFNWVDASGNLVEQSMAILDTVYIETGLTQYFQISAIEETPLTTPIDELETPLPPEPVQTPDSLDLPELPDTQPPSNTQEMAIPNNSL